MDTPGRLTQAEFRELYEQLRAQLPWGPADRRGALSYITPAEVLTAVGEVRLGRAVSLAAPVGNHVTADNPHPCQHQVTQPGSAAPARGLAFAMDRIAMNVHGNADTHIDALCHVIFDGELYNSVPASTVTTAGATELSIDLARNGIVRVGHRERREAKGPWDVARSRAGLHPTVLPYAAERRVSVLGCDSNSDTAASAVDGVDFPVHVLAINALGMHLLDYLQFEDLAPLCQETGRWSFLCIIAPLRLPHGTGSPVNPIAIT